MSKFLKLYLKVWKEFCQNPKNCFIFVFSLVATICMLSLLAEFICKVEFRQGFSFNDPFLTKFKPIDVTWLVFVVLYLSVFWGIITLGNTPKLLSQALLAYTLILVFRMFSMYLLPLEPPQTIIPLKDPFIEYFGTKITLTKDLFFSGHTALMFLLFLSARKKSHKLFNLTGTIIVASGVLLQHVHYSIDVLISFFVTYTCWNLSKIFCERFLV